MVLTLPENYRNDSGPGAPVIRRHPNWDPPNPPRARNWAISEINPGGALQMGPPHWEKRFPSPHGVLREPNFPPLISSEAAGKTPPGEGLMMRGPPLFPTIVNSHEPRPFKGARFSQPPHTAAGGPPIIPRPHRRLSRCAPPGAHN